MNFDKLKEFFNLQMQSVDYSVNGDRIPSDALNDAIEQYEKEQAADTQKHTPGELILTGVGRIGESSIVVRPAPKDGGDIICEAPHGWEDSMKRWRANAARIVQCWNGWDDLNDELLGAEAMNNVLKEENEQLKKQVEVLRGIAKRAAFLLDNYADGTLGKTLADQAKEALEQTKNVS